MDSVHSVAHFMTSFPCSVREETIKLWLICLYNNDENKSKNNAESHTRDSWLDYFIPIKAYEFVGNYVLNVSTDIPQPLSVRLLGKWRLFISRT